MTAAIGVDAGGTETVAFRFADGAEARSGAANPSALGVDRSAEAIARAVRALHGEGPLALFAGVAGAGREQVARELAARLQSMLGSQALVHVEGDARIALRATVPEGPGVVLAAGTGSFAYAVGPNGTCRVGAAGYLLGDEGSAFAIGQAALRLYARIIDRRLRDDEFRACIEDATGLRDRDGLMAFAYGAPAPVAAIAALAKPVVALGGGGHRAATRIVQQAAAELGELAKAAASGAGVLDLEPPVALYGGLMRENSLLTFLVETRVAADIPGAGVVRSSDPAGAARAAAALAVQLAAER